MTQVSQLTNRNFLLKKSGHLRTVSCGTGCTCGNRNLRTAHRMTEFLLDKSNHVYCPVFCKRWKRGISYHLDGIAIEETIQRMMERSREEE